MWSSGKEGKHADKRGGMRHIMKKERRKKRKAKARLVVLGMREKIKYRKCNKQGVYNCFFPIKLYGTRSYRYFSLQLISTYPQASKCQVFFQGVEEILELKIKGNVHFNTSRLSKYLLSNGRD